jgi:glycosyltransferase involved in cell wall biosynthesis
MRILMTNHSMHEIGGTEMWVVTVSKELVRRGHDVDVYTFIEGDAADLLPEGVGIHTTPPQTHYDLLLSNHNTCYGMVRNLSPISIYTSHGPSHKLELPVVDADVIVAVSEEVAQVAISYGKPSYVIRNPIDTNLFKPIDKPSGGSPKVLVMCKNIDASQMARQACDNVGFEYDVIHHEENPVDDVWNHLPNYEIAITSGRGVYEAMACGVRPFIFDRRSGQILSDGWVTPNSIRKIRQRNCSGRFFKLTPDIETIGHHLLGWERLNPAWMPEYVKQNHAVDAVVENYLTLYERVTDEQTIKA